MVAIGRPSLAGLDVLDRAAGDLPALLLVLTPIALLNALVGTRPGGSPGPAEMDAVVGAGGGAPGVLTGDVGFLGQVSAVQAVAGAAWDSSLLQSARGTCLFAGLLAAALLWPVLRRLGLSGNATATAVIVAGLGPLALRLQPSVDPGAVAAGWIALAAAIGFRVRLGPAGVVAVGAVSVVAMITTPLAAAGLLVAAAHALAGGALAGRLPAALRLALAGAAALGAGAAVAIALLSGPGGRGGTAVGLPALLAVIGLAALVLTRAWAVRPELRVLITAITVWLGCALVPGPTRLTSLLLVVPGLAVLIGALLGDADGSLRPRFSIAAAMAVTVALVSGVVTVLWPAAPPLPSSYEPLARWLTRELAEDVVLSAAPLDRAELIAAGVPASRFAADSVPAGAVTVVPTEAGCGQIGSPVVQLASSTGSLSVCAPAAREIVLSAGAGPQLAARPAVRPAEPARLLLEDGRVDSRLVTVLAGAAMMQPIEVADFPPVPGEPAAALRRTAVLEGVVRAVDVNGRPAASAVELYLNAQQPPFRPDVTALPDGRLVLHFRLATAAG
jgi:hypothetical protein